MICQAVHISSTGSLVMLAPSAVTPAQEAAWYGVYGTLLLITGVIAIMLLPQTYRRSVAIKVR